MAPAGISDINFTLDIDDDGGNEGGAAQAKREKTIIKRNILRELYDFVIISTFLYIPGVV